MEKSYKEGLKIFKEKAIHGLEKILLDDFPETFIFEVPSWLLCACKKSR